jgi:hypothetical protein
MDQSEPQASEMPTLFYVFLSWARKAKDISNM